jgi:hypothetical protein
MSQKSILEQALLQVQTLEEAVKQNAKGILASTMKQELNDLLKESMEEEEKKTPEEEETNDMPDVSGNDDDENLDNQNADDDDSSEDDDDSSVDDDETSADDDDMSTADDDMSNADDDMSNADDDMSTAGDDGVMDMTGASHDEVLKVWKAMKPEDGVIVKKDGEELEFNDGENEYLIKLDSEDEQSMDEEWNEEETHELFEEDMTDEGDMSEEETVYEIELDDEPETKHHKDSEEEESSIEGEFSEAARTKSNPHGNKNGMDRAGLPSKKKYKAGSTVVGINEELETLKRQNTEYKKALVLFKEKLNEVAVFNANLAYATRLFTENTTTKQEKLNILKRFDSVSTMNESKNLFSQINSELQNKKPISESVVEKISTTPTSSASKEVLAESKAYENPQFKRMKDLMSKIK